MLTYYVSDMEVPIHTCTHAQLPMHSFTSVHAYTHGSVTCTHSNTPLQFTHISTCTQTHTRMHTHTLAKTHKKYSTKDGSHRPEKNHKVWMIMKMKMAARLLSARALQKWQQQESEWWKGSGSGKVMVVVEK